MNIKNRKFGVEIECFGPILYDQFITERENHQLSNWARHIEPSIQNYPYGYHGYEIVSPILEGMEGLLEVEKMCNLLTKLEFRTNTSCGLHVHVDASDLTIEIAWNVFLKYIHYEDLIDSWMLPHRRGDLQKWAKSPKSIYDNLSKDTFDYIKKLITSNSDIKTFGSWWTKRSSKVNLCSLSCHQSIEFRQHHGTVDIQEINSWIPFCVNFVENVKQETLDPFNFLFPEVVKKPWEKLLKLEELKDSNELVKQLAA